MLWKCTVNQRLIVRRGRWGELEVKLPDTVN